MASARAVYLQPAVTVLNAISDVIELQNGRLTYADTPNGKIHFTLAMYSFKWELRFDVRDIGQNRSSVTLGIDGEDRCKDKMIRREFMLLDSLLVDRAKIEINEI